MSLAGRLKGSAIPERAGISTRAYFFRKRVPCSLRRYRWQNRHMAPEAGIPAPTRLPASLGPVKEKTIVQYGVDASGILAVRDPAHTAGSAMIYIAVLKQDFLPAELRFELDIQHLAVR